MPRRSSRTFRVYLRLLRRDIRRNARRLIVTKRARGQLIVVFTRPSFKTSRRYFRLWRQAKRRDSPRYRRLALGITLATIGIIGIGYSLVQLNNTQRPPTSTAAAVPVIEIKKPEAPTSMTRSLPTRLTAPDVAIDTSLIQLGQNPDGSLETPVAYDVAGWYKYSPTPGEIGPAVITGHVDNYEGAAVFYRLRELQPGQAITVTREDASIATFTVTKLIQVDQDNFPTQEVYGNTRDAQLRLITCGGIFNPLTGRYSQNTVVFATYAPPTGAPIDT